MVSSAWPNGLSCISRGCEVWYGHGSSDESIKPFGVTERASLLSYFHQVVHRAPTIANSVTENHINHNHTCTSIIH